MRLRALIPEIGSTLKELLGVLAEPCFQLNIIEDGVVSEAVDDELCDRSSPYFLLSLAGFDGTVGLGLYEGYLSVSMGAHRTPMEYALGASVAIAMARKFGSVIEDPWRYFGRNHECSGDEMMSSLRQRLPAPAWADMCDASDYMFPNAAERQ